MSLSLNRLIFTTILLLSNVAYGQKVIRIIKRTGAYSGQLILLEGERIKCKLKDGTVLKGRISHLSDSSFLVDNQLCYVDSIAQIGKRKKGAKLLTVCIVVPSLILLSTVNNLATLSLGGAALTAIVAKVKLLDSLIMLNTQRWIIQITDISKHNRSLRPF